MEPPHDAAHYKQRRVAGQASAPVQFPMLRNDVNKADPVTIILQNRVELGVIEGSFAALLTLQGLDISQSFTMAIIVRIFTLWVAIVVDFISLHLISRKNSV